MRRNGLAGRLRGRMKRSREEYERRASGNQDCSAVAKALARCDVVTVERGAAGGYIATVDDAYTGAEMATVTAALDSAMAAREDL